MIIDDDFISKEYAEVFRDKILFDFQPIWVFNSNTNRADEQKKYAVIDEKTLETFQMVAPIEANHPHYQKVINLFDRFLKKHGISCEEILRIKFNLITKSCEANGTKYNMPHIDSDRPHMVFLYYLNDSDGDTVFFEEMFEDKSVNNFTEKLRVSPKAGRGVVFDGYRYHASTSPVISPYRVILNIDFNGTLKDKL